MLMTIHLDYSVTSHTDPEQSIGFSECHTGSEYVPGLTAVPEKTY